jgi:hypothetical protein
MACGVAWAWPITTIGAVLATLAVGTLGVSARLSITTAGLAHAENDVAEMPQATVAHQSLTGIVTGAAVAAALGALLVVSGDLGAVLLTAVVGLVLVLRARTHIDIHRRLALISAGAAVMTASCGTIAISAPAQAYWIGFGAVAVGIGVLGRGFGATANVLMRRALDVLEYVALAAMLPLTCWVGDLYGMIRGLGLS